MKLKFIIENGLDKDIITWDSKTLNVTHSRDLRVEVEIEGDEE